MAESYPCPKTGRRGKGSSLGINNDVFKKMCRCIKITIPPKKHILAIFLSAAVVLKEEYESFFIKLKTIRESHGLPDIINLVQLPDYSVDAVHKGPLLVFDSLPFEKFDMQV